MARMCGPRLSTNVSLPSSMMRISGTRVGQPGGSRSGPGRVRGWAGGRCVYGRGNAWRCFGGASASQSAISGMSDSVTRMKSFLSG